VLRGLTVALLTSVLWISGAGPASAAYPGQNGKIAALHQGGIVAVDPATGVSDPIGGGPFPSQLVWSPDGLRLAYRSRTGPAAGEPGDIHVINANGSGDVFPHPADDAHPSWSPDATRIVFDSDRDGDFQVRELYTMNADGTNVQRLTNLEELEGQAHSPAWSPDGTQIAYVGRISTLPWRVRVMNADGTGDHAVTPEDFTIQSRLDWAPDASRIMVEGALDEDPAGQFFTVEPNGGNLSPLPNTADDMSGSPWVEYNSPRFSPDGARIVFQFHEFIPNAGGPDHLLSQRLDGTDRRVITSGGEGYGGPDWQPVPVNGYARPKAAGPLRVSLVVGHAECTTPNAVHGPPLEHPSCADTYNYLPTSSEHVIVGTPDRNGAGLKFVGFVRVGVRVGNPATPADEADLGLRVSATDVRCQTPAGSSVCGAYNVAGPADYSGELRARTVLQITDKQSTPAPGGAGAATTIAMGYGFDVPCTGTADEFVGSSCEIDTSADALMPGTVKEGARAIWQLGQVEVLDGGPDGDADTNPAENDVFLRQGILVP
jgi:Tol biopolymer transport system component